MTSRAQCRESGGRVVRIGRLVEIAHVATGTVRRCAGEFTSDVTLIAGHIHVRSGQGKLSSRVVVESRARPRDRRVASVAGSRKSCRLVRRIVRAVVVLNMAVEARPARQTVIVVHVALRARHVGVESGQCEPSGGVVEDDVGPRGGCVAQLACRWATCRRMVRVGGLIEIGHMTTRAIRRQR